MEQCRYERPRTSLLISGHHMKNGAMFAQLQDYTDQAFWEEHPFVQFDTVEEAGSYEVAAVAAISGTLMSTQARVTGSLVFRMPALLNMIYSGIVKATGGSTRTRSTQ